MLIEPADDPRFQMVTFEWEQPDDRAAPKDVLLRLQTITDKAYFDRDLRPYLLAQNGSGRWSLTLRLRDDLRCTHRFYPDYEGVLRADLPGEDVWFGPMRTTETVADVTNSSTFPGVGARPPSSLLELRHALAQPWCDRRSDVPAGTVIRHEFASALLGNTRPIWTYRPPGDHQLPLPVMVLLDGDCWIDIDIAATLDNLIAAKAIPPMAAVMVACLDAATRTRELTGTGHELFLRFLLGQLMPWVNDQIPVTVDPAATIIAGQSFGGLTAAYAGLHAPHRFGNVLTQSGSFWWPKDPDFGVDNRELIAEYVTAPPVPVRFYQEAGFAEWLLFDANRHMRDVLRAKGYDVTYREYYGGHDWACWRGGIADGLIALFTPSL